MSITITSTGAIVKTRKAKTPKTRKPRLSSDKRYFPKWHEDMSTREYIEAYFNANNQVYGNNTGFSVWNSLFAPHAA